MQLMIKAILSDFSYVLGLPKESGWEINQTLLNYLLELKKKQLTIAIYSSNDSITQEKIKNKLQSFKIFSSVELNLGKSEQHSYRKIAEKLGHKPEEIVFVDDQLINVEAAREAGMQIVYFTTTEETIKKLNTLVQ